MTKPEDVLAFINDYIEQNSFPPTVREIARGLQLASTSTVQSHLVSLQRKGLIRRGEGARTLVVVKQEGAE